MPDEKGEVRESGSSQWPRWTELFRCFQIAFDYRKLLLAAAGIVFMHFGWWLLALAFGSFAEPQESNYPASSYQDDEERAQTAYRHDHGKWRLLKEASDRYRKWPWEEHRGANPFQVVRDHREQLIVPEYYTRQMTVLLEPLEKFIGPGFMLLHPNAGFASTIFAILGVLWTLAVWSLFGGALTRMAAVEIARKEKLGLNDALKFATSKFISFFAAPIFPALGVAAICLAVIVVGFILLAIPYVGETLTSLLFFLPLLAGAAMVVLLLAYLGWPLMYATISAEGSDSFDALSRSYAYIFQRPWHYLFYTLVALLYGVITIFFVVFMTSFVVFMTKWGLSLVPWVGIWRATGDPATALFVYAPESYGWRDLLVGDWKPPHDNPMNYAQYAAAGIVSFWLHLIFLMMLGYAYSFFWTAFTMIYFLLRKQVDDTEMDEVYLEEEEERVFSPPPSSQAPPPTGGPTTLPMVSPSPPSGASGETPAPPSTGGDGAPPPAAN